MRYDVVVAGGEVLDPAAGLAGRMDVAISRGRVAAVEPSIAQDAAARVVDATGRHVVPGLIDLHAHVFWGADYFGVDADSIAWRSGVTTWVDAGSAGAFSLPAFREFIVRPARARILAFLNMSYLGLAGLNYDEYCNLRACDVDLFCRVAELNRDLVVGIKVRMGTEGVCGGKMEPLVRAIEVAERCDLPVMCHISQAPPPLAEILPLLRPGDIVTHAFTGLSEKIVDETGRLRDEARRARDRGVVFDVGHGAGSFSFETGEALAAQGFWPDVISTDLHQVSLPGPNLIDPESQDLVARVRGDGSPQFTLLTVMSKFLHLGMPLAEVVSAVTSRPAEVLGRAGEIGSLAPGSTADLALLEIEEGETDLFDTHGNRRRAARMVRCRGVLAGGRELPPKQVPPTLPWIRLVDEGADR